MGDEIKDSQGRVVAFYPNPGPQTEFLQSDDYEILFGGAAGGGKSHGLLASAALDYHSPSMRGIIIRREFKQLKDLIEKAKTFYSGLGGYWVAGNNWFKFRDGGVIEFAHAKLQRDVEKYQGREFTFLGFDELTHWENSDIYRYMISRVRSVDPEIKLRIRGTTNPGSAGHNWVKKWWRIPGVGGRTLLKVKYPDGSRRWRRFIPSRIHDNPYLSGTDYESNLDLMSPNIRKMLKEGRWDVVAGAAFDDFDHKIHTCDPFPIPEGTKIWRGGDDGYAAPACVIWLCKFEETHYAIREIYRKRMLASDLGKLTVQEDKKIVLRAWHGKKDIMNSVRLGGIMDSAAFNEVGLTGPEKTGRGQIMNRQGARWTRAQKGPGSRLARVNLLRELLKVNPNTGRPGIIFFKSCRNLIETIPTLPVDPDNPEDVDTDAEDHAYDALTYGLQSERKGARMVKV